MVRRRRRRRRQQAADRAVRPPMRSPGTPSLQREIQRLFWIEIAKGLLQAEAAIAVGASQQVGQRWFHNAGGMPPFDLKLLSGRYLSFREREEIALLKAQGVGVKETARAIGRDPSTILNAFAITFARSLPDRGDLLNENRRKHRY